MDSVLNILKSFWTVVETYWRFSPTGVVLGIVGTVIFLFFGYAALHQLNSDPGFNALKKRNN